MLLEVQALHHVTFSLNFLTTLCMIVTHFDCSHLLPLLLSSHHGQHPSLPPSRKVSSSCSSLFILFHEPLSLTRDIWMTLGLELSIETYEGWWAHLWASLPLVFFSSHEFSMERWGSVSPSPMTGCWHVRYCANPVQIIAAAVSSWWLSHTQGMTFHSLSLPLPTLICFLPFLVWYFLSFIGDGIYALIRDKHSVVPNSRILAAMSHYLTIIPPLISFYLPEMFWCLHISLWNANKWLPPPLVSLPHFSYPAKMPWRMTTASFETWIQLLFLCIMSCCSLG